MHQSALTGESAPVAKRALDVPDPALSGAGPFAQPQWCFQGSSVTSGSSTAVIVAAGVATRFATAHDGRAGQRGASAFDRSVQGLSWTLIRFMLLTPPLVLMANAALRGRGLETLPFAVAVTVGLTPEILPVIATTTLARGAARLARTSGVIVKRFPALHDLGAVDVLCLDDRTGTLTEDRLVVAETIDGADRPDPDVLRWAAVRALWTLRLAEVPSADALDEAVLDAAEECGPSAAGEVDPEAYEGVAVLPFDPVRRVATAVVRRPGWAGAHTLATKGRRRGRARPVRVVTADLVDTLSDKELVGVVNRANGVELARYDLSEDASTETAMVFGELYRHGFEWKFRAVGQGYASGLAGIASDYGVNV